MDTHHCVPVLETSHIFWRLTPEHAPGDELALGTGAVRHTLGVVVPTEGPCRYEAQNLEVGWRAVAAGWVRQTVAHREVTSVALVSDSHGADADDIAIHGVGALEDPVLRPVHRVTAGSGPDCPTDAVIAAA